MTFEIDEPGPGPDDGKLVVSNGKILVWCDCTGADRCPQSKVGSMARCRIWLELKHVSEELVAECIRMNTFSR
jgi:hypothetical protein